jgi:nicotinamidase-related amidase
MKTKLKMFTTVLVMLLLTVNSSAQTQNKKSALILIEFQNDWIDSGGTIYGQFKDKEQFEASIKNAQLVLAEARKRNMDVIYAVMTFDPSYKQLGQAKYGFRALLPKYQSFLGKQNEIDSRFKPLPNEYVIRERTASSAFEGTTLDSYLRNNHIEEIYLMGYALHLCLESSLRQAHDLGYDTNVIWDASSAFTREQQQYFLNNVAPFYGNPIKTNDFLLKK